MLKACLFVSAANAAKLNFEGTTATNGMKLVNVAGVAELTVKGCAAGDVGLCDLNQKFSDLSVYVDDKIAELKVYVDEKMANHTLVSQDVDTSSCWKIKAANPLSVDGYFRIKSATLGYDFTTYCDMSGGGWTLVGRQQQSSHTGCEDCFFNGCGCTGLSDTTCLKNCQFNLDKATKSLTGTNEDFAFLNDKVKGSEQKQEFYNYGSPSGTSQSGGSYLTTKSTAAPAGVASAMCVKDEHSVAYWTLKDDGSGNCDIGNYNINIGSGRRWANSENDELCDYTCANAVATRTKPTKSAIGSSDE